MKASILISIAFFVGAIPFGLLIGRLFAGVDVRTIGSGNIGATNVARTLGKKLGALTLILDVAKGLAAVHVSRAIMGPGEDGAGLVPAIAGLAAFLGHIYSPFLKFKGGKGVATALGVYIGLAPLALVPALGVFLVTVVIWRYVSLGSLAASLMAPLAAFLLNYPLESCWLTSIMAVFIFIRHKDNLRRLLKGQENKWRAAKDRA